MSESIYELYVDYLNLDEMVSPGVAPAVPIDYEVVLAAIDDDGIIDVHYVVTELLHHPLVGLGDD